MFTLLVSQLYEQRNIYHQMAGGRAVIELIIIFGKSIKKRFGLFVHLVPMSVIVSRIN